MPPNMEVAQQTSAFKEWYAGAKENVKEVLQQIPAILLLTLVFLLVMLAIAIV